MNDNIKVEFSEPFTEEEHVGYTTDFSKWVEFCKEKNSQRYDGLITYFDKIVSDGELVEFFRDAAGFMLAPVAKRGSDILETRTRSFNSIDDLRENLDLEKVFVYKIIDMSGNKIKEEYKIEAQALIFLGKEVPEHMMEYVENDYRIRYAELPA